MFAVCAVSQCRPEDTEASRTIFSISRATEKRALLRTNPYDLQRFSAQPIVSACTFTMSCLPLFFFSSSTPSASEQFEDSKSDAQSSTDPSIALGTGNEIEGLYRKLSRVLSSHRRVNSFEWVMTRSAPNSPPIKDDTSHEMCFTPSERLIASAPLPVPDELWSDGLYPKRGKQQRGYFEWWSSPSVGNNHGYAMVPGDEEVQKRLASILRVPVVNTPKICTTDARTIRSSRSRAASPPSTECDRLSPSALGIIFPDTPLSSPPTSRIIENTHLQVTDRTSSLPPASRLPKRVTFSPVVDDLAAGSFRTFPEQHTSSWGSYLPSAFLVARPPSPRKILAPITRASTVIKPILRRSVFSETQQTSPIEMVCFIPRTKSQSISDAISTIPAQRLSVSLLSVFTSSTRDSIDADKRFVTLLRPRDAIPCSPD